jgi:hypothetical protein
VHHRRGHQRGDAGAEARRAEARSVDRRRRGRCAHFRSREPHAVPAAHVGVRGEPVAGRLHRGSVRSWHHLAHDGRRWLGAALGRRHQPVFGRGSHAAIAVRPIGRLACHVVGPRALLLRGRAPPRRVGRARAASGRSAIRAVSDATHAAVLEPAAAEDMGRAERYSVLGHAAGEEHAAVRRAIGVPALQHV